MRDSVEILGEMLAWQRAFKDLAEYAIIASYRPNAETDVDVILESHGLSMEQL